MSYIKHLICLLRIENVCVMVTRSGWICMFAFYVYYICEMRLITIRGYFHFKFICIIREVEESKKGMGGFF